MAISPFSRCAQVGSTGDSNVPVDVDVSLWARIPASGTLFCCWVIPLYPILGKRENVDMIMQNWMRVKRAAGVQTPMSD